MLSSLDVPGELADAILDVEVGLVESDGDADRARGPRIAFRRVRVVSHRPALVNAPATHIWTRKTGAFSLSPSVRLYDYLCASISL